MVSGNSTQGTLFQPVLGPWACAWKFSVYGIQISRSISSPYSNHILRDPCTTLPAVSCPLFRVYLFIPVSSSWTSIKRLGNIIQNKHSLKLLPPISSLLYSTSTYRSIAHCNHIWSSGLVGLFLMAQHIVPGKRTPACSGCYPWS